MSATEARVSGRGAVRPALTEGALALAAPPATRDGRHLLQAVPGAARPRETPRKVKTTAQKRMAPPPYDPSPEAETAYADLNHRLLLARERGEVVPCLGEESSLWLSQHADEQERAADGCFDCPAMLLCKQYADLADEYVGTWGGVTRDPAQPVSRRAETVARRARKRPAGGRDCSCGCGGWTKGGRYLPGHDSQHLARLVRYVRDGAIPEARALRDLAESPGLRAKLLTAVRR